jgi:hypothetical protein
MSVYRFAYYADGARIHAGEFGSGLGTAQEFAEALARLPLERPVDEFRVWVDGDTDRAPDGVAVRPLSTEPAGSR